MIVPAGGGAKTLADLGVTASATEVNYVDGVTSAIQTQLDGKAAHGDATLFRGSEPPQAYHGTTAAERGAAIASMFDDAIAGDVLMISCDATITATLTLKANQTVIVNGVLTADAANLTMFSGVSVDAWAIVGHGKLVGQRAGTERGIFISNCQRVTIRGIELYNWIVGIESGGGAGISGDCLLSGLRMRENVTGAKLADFQYSTVGNCAARQNTLAIDIRDNNICIDSLVARDNVNGILATYASGVGDHGTICNSHINHSTGYAMKFTNMVNGYTVVGTHVFGSAAYGGIIFDGGKGVQFLGGAVEALISVTGTPAGRHTIRGAWINSSVASISATPAQRRFLKVYGCEGYAGAWSENDPSTPVYGGTGLNAISAGSIPFADASGNLRQDATNFTRTSAGATALRGPTVLSGASYGGDVGQIVIESGANANVAAIVQGVNDSISPPVSVAGLSPLLWWRADALALESGQAIATVPDSSGNGRIGSTNSSYPVYFVARAINGLPAMYFDATTSHYIDSPSFSQSSPFTLFVVAKKNTVGNNRVLCCGKSTSAGMVYAATSSTWTANNGTDRTFSCAPTDWNILEMKFNSAASSLRANGGTATASDPGASVYSSGFRLGNYTANSIAYAFDGYVAEVILFAGAMSSANMEGVRQYLASKYAIAITQGTSGAANQTADLMRFRRNSGATTRSFIDYEGNLSLKEIDSSARDAIASPTGKFAMVSGVGLQFHDGSSWKTVGLT